MSNLQIACATVIGMSRAAMTSPFSAPPTAFNAAISGRRSVAYAQLDLDDA